MPEEEQSALVIFVPAANSFLTAVDETWNDGDEMQGIPAHLTLLYPFMPPGLIDAQILAELQELFASHHSINSSLKLGWFGREVLLLEPEDPEPFVSLTKALVARWPEYPHYNGEYDEIVPHVTIANGSEPDLVTFVDQIQASLPLVVSFTEASLCVGVPPHMPARAAFALGSTAIGPSE